MGRKYHSDICMGIHESMKELLDIGAISEAEMREFDELCFDEEPDRISEPVFVAERSAEPGHATA